MFRVAPKAVCRQILASIDTKPLTSSEQQRILRAIRECQVPDATERLMAALTRGTIEHLMDKI